MATGNAKRFIALDVAPTLAIELAAQITASAGDKRRLGELGMDAMVVNLVVPAVATHTVDVNKLSQAGMPNVLAKEFAAQIAS